LVSEYLLKFFPYEDLAIFELGGGNGTLASNILDFLKCHYPEVYDRTQYHIVEISPQLAERQRQLLLPKHPMLKITNRDIFLWDRQVSIPCFVLAAEVVVSD
jgi:SAM-dependent MidA family methyltransferase